MEIRIFENSLLEYSSAELGRSYGVFVMVRGRLLNEEDYQHLIQEPSFGTLYRTQITIWADGLDAALLADRERLSVARPETAVLRVLEQAAYLTARKIVNNNLDAQAAEELVSTILPTNLRELWHDPISGYATAHRQEDRFPDPSNDDFLSRTNIGDDQPVATYDGGEAQFNINTSHPIRRSIDQQIGGGKKADKLRRLFDMYAVAEVLLEGYLIDRGLTPDEVQEIADWRDGLFREVARRFEQAPDELQARVREASYQGDKVFEIALRDLFKDMGFEANRVGGSGELDVLVVAPVGKGHHEFTVEAKGSKDKVSNITAHIAGVAKHRSQAKAQHALIIARDFTGFTKGDQAAVLEECRQVDRVSVVTLDVLFSLHEIMHKYYYPLDVVLNALREVQTPEDQMARVESLAKPNPAFDFPTFLETVWGRQQAQAKRELVFYQSVRQDNEDWRTTLDDGEMTRQMVMLERAAGGLVRVDTDKQTITLLQSPAMVLTAIRATFTGIGYSHL